MPDLAVLPLDSPHTVSLPCCGQRQHSGHSCVSPGSAAGVARGSLLFSHRGVVLLAVYPARGIRRASLEEARRIPG